MSSADQFFVLTGGPGSGKSTLIDALARSGYHHKPESGRAIIQEQVAIGGTALPWSDRQGFAERMLRRDIHSYQEAEALAGPVLFDRGIPDVIGYLRLSGLPVPSHMEEAASRYGYNRRVLIAPPWPEIFVRDAERKQTIKEAEATYRAMIDVYSGLGYELIHLPLASVRERLSFVRQVIASSRPAP